VRIGSAVFVPILILVPVLLQSVFLGTVLHLQRHVLLLLLVKRAVLPLVVGVVVLLEHLVEMYPVQNTNVEQRARRYRPCRRRERRQRRRPPRRL